VLALHPGTCVALERLRNMTGTETEIGWKIARGELPSPVRLPGFALFALRFSGTGTAWRESLGEHVFRPPAEYLTAEMCARIAGAPVVAVHPDKGSLDTASYVRTVIGAIMFGYIADSGGIQSDIGDELWCIARIGDGIAAEAMATGQFSTSPAVVFAADSGNETMLLPDGSSILFEGRPAVIDHLAALIEAGVWDKRGAAGPGIRTDTERNSDMAETEAEKKAREEREDKARKDDDARKRADEKIDKVLSHLDDVAKRLDALERGANKSDDDAAKRRRADDAKRRRDAEREAWRRDDAAQCERDDAEEHNEMDRLIHLGEPEEVAADKAREWRKDRMAKRRADATKIRTAADAERERREEGERADAQARADAVAMLFGERAPAPLSGEDTLSYRRRLLRRFMRYSDKFKDSDLGAIADAATFNGVETVVYADAARASKTPDFPVPGTMVPRTRNMPGGHEVTEWVGNVTIFKQFAQPPMYVTKFLTPQSGHAA